MALKWWQWKHIDERLRLWGRALQGVEPYRIELVDEPGLTGLTNFTTAAHQGEPGDDPRAQTERGVRDHEGRALP